MENTLGLTGKALLAHQASAKIETGRRMVEEGRLELINLFPGVSERLVANRILSDQKLGSFKMSTRTDDELMSIIMKMIKNREKVTANTVQERLSITRSHVNRLRAKLQSKIIEKKTDGKRTRTWHLAGAGAGKSDSPDLWREEEILNLLKTSNWWSLFNLRKAAGIGWYTLNDIVQHLVKKGLAKKIKKANNPAHKNTTSYGREFVYWVAV